MKKQIIGLTIKSIEQILINSYDYTCAASKLYQHKILISDSILKKYRLYFQEIEEPMLFDKWFEEVNRNDDHFEFLDSLDDENEIIAQMENIDNHMVVITQKESVHSSIINPIFLNDLNDFSVNTKLDWYCIPFNTIIKKNTENNIFFDWLKDLLYNEKKVVIIDPYICKNENRDVFDAVLKCVDSSEVTVHVYFDGEKTQQTDISYLKNIYGGRLIMHESDFKNNGHDRFIYCNSFVLSIGIGLDVFNFSTSQTRKETNISLANSERPTIPDRYIRRNRR